jgi:hypothetical protein
MRDPDFQIRRRKFQAPAFGRQQDVSENRKRGARRHRATDDRNPACEIFLKHTDFHN